MHRSRYVYINFQVIISITYFFVDNSLGPLATESSCIILPRQMSFFFKHRSLKDALSSPDSPMEQAFTYAAVCSVLQYTATETSQNLRL